MAKKKVPTPDFFCSADTKDVRFGRVYPGQLQSEAFKALPLGARYFYLLCRCQEQSETGKRCLYQHAAQHGRKYPAGCFVFPASALHRYGVDSGNASRYFKVLIEAGFLRMVECNKAQRLVNVYAFSAEWKKTALSEKQKTSVSHTEEGVKKGLTSVSHTEEKAV